MRVRLSPFRLTPILLGMTLAACKKSPPPPPPPAQQLVSATASASSSPVTRKKPARATGSALARGASSSALYLADEDAGVIRRVALPLSATSATTELKVSGPPAQVLARDGEIFVTQRDPGKLLVLADDTDSGGALREAASVDLPADAWGMALSPDESTLLVTSAWTHTVSVVDVAKRTVLAKLDVAREPRGVVFAPDGKKAWVTHLVGTAVTRIDVDGAQTKATAVALPAGTARAARRVEPSASLAYSPVISDDGSRLFVPRHALGTVSTDPGSDGWSAGSVAWWGTSTVDVLLLSDETPLMPPRASVATLGRFGAAVGMPPTPTPPEVGSAAVAPPSNFVQPRDTVYRKSTRTLLIVGEGSDGVTEHDTLALDPGLFQVANYQLGQGYLEPKSKAPWAESGSAPQAIALSEDELSAFVWMRGSRDIIGFPLSTDLLPKDGTTPTPSKHVQLPPFPEPFTKEVAAGRKLFYLGRQEVMSDALACAGCHPDGRDDGFVWHETKRKLPKESNEHAVFVGTPSALFTPEDDGKPRQTPMLAGRVSAEGPYGWHGQNKNIEERLIEGFGLHRWLGNTTPPTEYEKTWRLAPLKSFLRKGLRPPPRNTAPLTPEEERGKVVFEDEKTMCKTCHPSETEYTTRLAVALKSPLPTRAGFAEEENQVFKTPSLFFVGGTPPYYHDGSVKTLAELIDGNGHRMGETSHLSSADRAALVAFLGRL